MGFYRTNYRRPVSFYFCFRDDEKKKYLTKFTSHPFSRCRSERHRLPELINDLYAYLSRRAIIYNIIICNIAIMLNANIAYDIV